MVSRQEELKFSKIPGNVFLRIYANKSYVTASFMFISKYYYIHDRLCGLVVRVSGYRYRGLVFDSRRYQIF